MKSWHKRSTREGTIILQVFPSKFCEKYNMKRSDKWYEHTPEGVVENEEVKVLWDVMIQCEYCE